MVSFGSRHSRQRDVSCVRFLTVSAPVTSNIYHVDNNQCRVSDPRYIPNVVDVAFLGERVNGRSRMNKEGLIINIIHATLILKKMFVLEKMIFETIHSLLCFKNIRPDNNDVVVTRRKAGDDIG